MHSGHSVFAFGLQQACQTIPLFLRPARREQVVQMMVVSALRAPDLGEVPNHDPHLCLNAVLLEIVAQKRNDLS